MDENGATQLPWDALKAAEGEIPWAALEQFAEALVADSSLLRPLEDLYTEAREALWETERYEDLYVPAIFALAAPRLNDEMRREAAAFLVEKLIQAGHDDDDISMELLTAACGSLGPAALPSVLSAVANGQGDEGAWVWLWTLTKLAAGTPDAELRNAVVKACNDTLHRAIRGEMHPIDAEPVAWTVAHMACKDSRPLLQHMAKEAAKKSGDTEFVKAIRILDAKSQYPPVLELWEQPVRQWLESNWRSAKEFYAEGAAEPAEESIYDAGLRRAEKLAGRFAKSEAARTLPPDALEDAEFIAAEVLSLAWSYGQVRPEDLDEDALREVLLTIVPRKVMAKQSVFQNVVPVTRALLAWLQSEGILENAAPLAGAVASWDRLVVEKAMDSSSWDRSKRFLMQAQREGVALTDDRAMRRLAVRYNRQLAGEKGRQPSGEPALSSPPAPPGKAAKVGRNAPCPCGSGKKYKKCCGRPGAVGKPPGAPSS